jgi:hypothetical protein
VTALTDNVASLRLRTRAANLAPDPADIWEACTSLATFKLSTSCEGPGGGRRSTSDTFIAAVLEKSDGRSEARR